jgi:hypothetical protein
LKKRRTKVLYVDFSYIVFRFLAKIKPGLVKTKDGPGPDKKIFEPGPGPEKNKKCRSGPGSGHARGSLLIGS